VHSPGFFVVIVASMQVRSCVCRCARGFRNYKAIRAKNPKEVTVFEHKIPRLPRARRLVALPRFVPVLLLLGIVGGGGISGCATSSPAHPAGMTEQDLRVQRSHPYSIRVEARGGQATDPKGPSQISNEAFAQALADSIRDSGLFARVISGEAPDYLLRVAIVNLDQPPKQGFSMTVQMETTWTLVKTDHGDPVWADSIRSSYTASAISSRKAVTRMRLATEGAARANIRQGMEKISRLELR